MDGLKEYVEVFKRFEQEDPTKLSDEEWDWILANQMYAPIMIEEIRGGKVQSRFQAPAEWGGRTLNAELLKEYSGVFRRYQRNREQLQVEEMDWIRANSWFTPYMILHKAKGVVQPRAGGTQAPAQAPVGAPAAEVQAPVLAPAAEPQAHVLAPAAAAQAPAKQLTRKAPQSDTRAKPKRNPKKPKQHHVRQNPPGPYRMCGKWNFLLSEILKKPFSRKQHASTDDYFPRCSLLVKPCKTMDDVWKTKFPDGRLDVYWSRKWDCQLVYLVFCKVYPYVTAYSSSGEKLELRKIIDALRAACVPALDDGEVIIVKAEICTEVPVCADPSLGVSG